MEYRLDEKGVLNKQESAPKRFTYLLGKGAKIRTAVERFSRLNKNATLGHLKTAFAVEQLNKEFYEKLFKWYENAKLRVTFPNDEKVDPETHTATSLIRLLTRLLFVWFLKEKNLVNRDFFEPGKIRQMIDCNKKSSYYKAILQNLFFATLNREIPDRSFRTTQKGRPTGNNYLVPNVYRYQNIFRERDKRAIVRQFDKTPFLNGGLFECLDREANEGEQQAYKKDKTIRNEQMAIRIDGFSDRNDNVLQVPNDLFFEKNEKQPGLITLLHQYQFTVEESTPLDSDVALDPELLGLVFENLLASYNPETRETARKQTGSYYTPREIVSYMVDESLKAYLAQTVEPSDGDMECYRDRLNDLFDTLSRTGDLKSENGQPLLYDEEIIKMVKAVEQIKILDPAVGSGAFPMGCLQRLVQILGLIDPKNELWKQRQVDIVSKMDDSESRASAIQEIDEIFSKENRFNDFGRKLYLIQKCIYGVDIQPIACQIAKLRFFISLTIEQEPNPDAPNLGIKPLPNLETRFVSANTLLGLEGQRILTSEYARDLERQLHANRELYFHATTRQKKLACRNKEKELRGELATELGNFGSPTADVEKSHTGIPTTRTPRPTGFTLGICSESGQALTWSLATRRTSSCRKTAANWANCTKMPDI